MITPLVLGVAALTALWGAVTVQGAAVRLGRARQLGAVVGAAAGLTGLAAVMVPLRFCTFSPEASLTDRWFGIALIAGASLLAVRLATSAIDPDARTRRRESGDDITHGVFQGNPLTPWLLLAPTLAILVLFLYWPVIRTVQLSTQLVRLGAPRGVDRCVSNFTELIGPARPGLAAVALVATIAALWSASLLNRSDAPPTRRWASLLTTVGVVMMLTLIGLLWTTAYQPVYVVTLIISLGTVAGGLLLSLAIAYLAYQPIRGAGIYRTLLVWPYAISPPIAGLIFFVMFDPTSGLIEHWLESLFGIALPNYRQSPGLAQLVVILASIWKTLGYNLLFYIAGLQTVPNDQIEAATLDGAGGLQRFRYIVIPALSPITFFLVVTNLTYAFFETYGTIDYLTAGGPSGATSVAMYEIIEVAIPGRDLGRGAAQSLVLFAGVVALTVWQFRSTGRRVSYGS